MSTTKLGDTILEREFESEDADGNVTFIAFRLGIPYKLQDAQGVTRWRCAYQITGIGTETVHFAMGVDAIDAILICLRLADNTMKTYQKDTKITWLGKDNLGLIFSPVEQLGEKEYKPIREDENSPFREIFDEFFLHSKRNRNASKTDD
jgi:hypothetical protein